MVSDEPAKQAVEALDRRGNPRRSTVAVFTLRFSEESLMGAGRDVSDNGAYFITGDDIQTEVSYEVKGKEVTVPATVVRIERISAGTMGVAVRFDRKPGQYPR